MAIGTSRSTIRRGAAPPSIRPVREFGRPLQGRESSAIARIGRTPHASPRPVMVVRPSAHAARRRSPGSHRWRPPPPRRSPPGDHRQIRRLPRGSRASSLLPGSGTASIAPPSAGRSRGRRSTSGSVRLPRS
jgi:hypothetical protein